MKNRTLFAKTCIHLFGLIVSMILVTFFLIYSLLPTFYHQYKQKALDAHTKQLASELRLLSAEQTADRISAFALAQGYGYAAAYENGELLCSAGIGINVSMVGAGAGSEENLIQLEFACAESKERFQTADGRTVELSLTVSLQPIDDAMSVLLLVLPMVLVFCLILSAVVACFYAKSIARPIQTMAQTTIEMQSLRADVSCAADRSDEIGILARNINEMYQTLLATISDLEREIETVERSEREKLDFLLLASHELKTPVTAVRGMIDGMIYHVGRYKDRDRYLKECQKSLEGLTELICDILTTSKMDLSTAARDSAPTDLGRLLKEAAEPYFVIAQSHHIVMTLSCEDYFCACIPAEPVKKALSNLIANAVKYTTEGCAIRIWIKDRSIGIENECEPLSEEELAHLGEPFYHPLGSKQDSGSTGLGLYLTDRILNVCGLSYSFEPYEAGMRFTLYF